MNQKAKRRHQQGLFGPLEAPAEEPVVSVPVRMPVEPISPGLTEFLVEAPERLDKFLAHRAGLSRTRVKALIETRQVEIDGSVVVDPGAKLRAGQSVRIDVPPPAPAEPSGEAIPLDIVFEDEHLIVVHKPVGMVVHPSAGHDTGTLVNALIAHCGASLSGIGGVMRPGIVHRIDRDTSGLLVVAKTDAAHQGLSALFADHGRTLHLVREYLAFCWGAPDRRNGTIDTFIGRHQHNREKQVVTREEGRGRHAITHYEIEETYGSDKGHPLVSLVRCALETGRTHQIRVHMAHIGHPLLGDPVYGPGFRTKAKLLPEKARAVVEGMNRQALHAASLGFAHPVTGEELLFESELPEDLQGLREALEALD